LISTPEILLNIDTKKIKSMLDRKGRMKIFLSVCASCGACADSCFYYRNSGDPESTPSYKALNSLGIMFRKWKKLDYDDLTAMKKLIWGKCVMCRRCYCPLGIDISSAISWARTICRANGVYEDFSEGPSGIKDK
jgi:Fe-S oxidoreductase